MFFCMLDFVTCTVLLNYVLGFFYKHNCIAVLAFWYGDYRTLIAPTVNLGIFFKVGLSTTVSILINVWASVQFSVAQELKVLGFC